jgi:hypothetical protein
MVNTYFVNEHLELQIKTLQSERRDAEEQRHWLEVGAGGI